MTDPTPDPVLLARHIAQQISRLTDHLAVAPPRQAAQMLGHVLAPDGVLDRMTGLVAAGSRFAKDRATSGALPPEVWLALGRASNDLDAICGDLAEHTEDINRLTQTPATATARPVASALVARRHR
ncbi:hypothetical protein Slala04_02110 [Streptomyces lavendulae subsp. lavendulae]|nr:hypothetical protein Slala04_02110 [Streptomyces lavendulae subsp. lavendulae]